MKDSGSGHGIDGNIEKQVSARDKRSYQLSSKWNGYLGQTGREKGKKGLVYAVKATNQVRRGPLCAYNRRGIICLSL